jgi:hypothetical protein
VQTAALRSSSQDLSYEIAEAKKTISELQGQISRQRQELAEAERARVSAEAQVQESIAQSRHDADAVGALATERDVLQHRLADAEHFLENVRDDINHQQEEHLKALARATDLQARIDDLTVQLSVVNSTAEQQKEFLTADRDIRELMGARQLYVADVFDVDHNGKNQAPFGRMFYTRGKSLIFYAFDLDQPPQYRNAKAFQIWGSPSEDESNPVSLGVFYKDSDASRRWVFKTDDPDALATINAVFVTVEAKGPSKVPTGKPILYAYLRSAPANHP